MGECKKCGKCCRSTEQNEKIVIVYPSDVKKITEKLRIRKEEFFHEYCREEFLEYSEGRIRLWILKKKENHCIFLTDPNRCKIYEFRPVQCINAPYNYFANKKMWGDMDCVDIVKLRTCDTREQDKKLMLELLEENSYEEDV